MAEQKSKQAPGSQKHVSAQEVSSAPELPAHVAKEYGLHHLVEETEKQESSSGRARNLEDQDVDPAILDPKTNAAVEDIVAKESDDLLAAQDAFDSQAAAPPAKAHSWPVRVLLAWVRNPWARWISLIVLFAVLAACILVPQARYLALNTVGVRSSVGVTIVDTATRLPLKNVTVRIGTLQAQTDIKGQARLSGVKLGKQKLSVKRLAFAPLSRTITVGWGSNPLGTLQLQATGLKYVIEVRDYVSDTELEGVEASSSDGLNALSDKKGVITFAVSDTDPAEMMITITRKGYRSKQLTLKPAAPTGNTVRLVPDARVFYYSNAGGKYNLHAVDADGKNNKIILPATGSEGSNLFLAAAPSGEWVATVSTRDGARSRDGYLLRGLTLVNQDGGNVQTVERAEQIRLVDWIGSRLIYQVTVAGASAANNQRNRLISYDYATNSRVQLAAANQFNAVLTVRGVVYYAVAGGDASSKPVLARVRPDGTGRQTIWSKEIWTVLRTGYETLALQTPDGWFTYTAGGNTPSKSETGADGTTGRHYVENAQASKAAWVDIRDGKGVILMDTIPAPQGGSKETRLATADGVTYPLRWLNETTLAYRRVTDAEAADYVVSTLGGQPRKVTDLTNTYGFVQ